MRFKVFHWSVTFRHQVYNPIGKTITSRVKHAQGTACLVIIKLFHFVREKGLKDWLGSNKTLDTVTNPGYRTKLDTENFWKWIALSLWCGSETKLIGSGSHFLWILDPDPTFVPDPTLNSHSFTMQTIFKIFSLLFKAYCSKTLLD
jgi:hypothetical protein